MTDSEQAQIEDLVESLQNKKNSTRRNLDKFGTLSDINIAFSDILLLFGSLMSLPIFGNIVPDGRNWALLTLGLSTLFVGGTLLGIYTSPSQMSFYKWLRCKIGFRFGSDYRSAPKGDAGRITKDSLSTNGDRRALEDLTRVDGFAPQSDAVWRFDGALVGGVSIDPAELSLASNEDWEDAANELGRIINSLEYSGQLRNGSVKIDTETVKRAFGSRLGDTDVRSNPNLQQNVAMYKTQLPDQMDSKNASIRGFQMLVPVTMEGVQMQGHRVLGRLDDIPVIGSGIASMLASRDLTVAEIRYRQEQELTGDKGRLASLENDLGGITGCDASRLSMDGLINVLEESWTGERVVSEERDDRSLPLVTMQREYTETEGDTRSPDQLADDELDQQIIEDLQRSAGVGGMPNLDPDPEGTTDLSDEDHGRRTVTDGDLDDAPEPEPEPESPVEPAIEQAQSEETTDSDSVDEISVDVDDYESLESACAALVEKIDQADAESETTDSGTEQEAVS